MKKYIDTERDDNALLMQKNSELLQLYIDKTKRFKALDLKLSQLKLENMDLLSQLQDLNSDKIAEVERVNTLNELIRS